jgi:hypothetical protein
MKAIAPPLGTSGLLHEDLGVFVALIRGYFKRVGGGNPEMLEPAIELRPPSRHEFTGYIPLSGSARGWIALSLPRPMLLALLKAIGEDLEGEDILRDLSGEVATTIVSNARAHFGPRLGVAPPTTTHSDEPAPLFALGGPVFHLPFTWKRHRAWLLIALEPNASAA